MTALWRAPRRRLISSLSVDLRAAAAEPGSAICVAIPSHLVTEAHFGDFALAILQDHPVLGFKEHPLVTAYYDFTKRQFVFNNGSTVHFYAA